MEKVKIEIIVAILVNVNGYERNEAIKLAKECIGDDVEREIDKILNNRFKKAIEFTKQISTLDKGCSPSVGLMDERIDIAKKAIESFSKE